MKLRWAKLSGGSTKQVTDAKRVFELQYSNIDMSYINKWVMQLNIEEEWKKLKEEANPLV